MASKQLPHWGTLAGMICSAIDVIMVMGLTAVFKYRQGEMIWLFHTRSSLMVFFHSRLCSQFMIPINWIFILISLAMEKNKKKAKRLCKFCLYVHLNRFAMDRFKSILSEPDFGTKQDEQHPGHGEYQYDQQRCKYCIPSVSPGFGSCHLLG